MSRRAERVSERIRQEISEILLREIKDPRVRGLVSVTHVETTPDLKHARVLISVLGSDEERREVLKGLEAALGFIRRELGTRLGLRYVPDLVFHMDESIERGARILQLLRDVVPEETEEEEPS